MIEEVRIDVRDVDHEWFRDVRAFLDRASDLYYLPCESAERLGEIDEDTGDFFLIDGQVEAKAGEIEVGGVTVLVWTVAFAQLKVNSLRGLRPHPNGGEQGSFDAWLAVGSRLPSRVFRPSLPWCAMPAG